MGAIIWSGFPRVAETFYEHDYDTIMIMTKRRGQRPPGYSVSDLSVSRVKISCSEPFGESPKGARESRALPNPFA